VSGMLACARATPQLDGSATAMPPDAARAEDGSTAEDASTADDTGGLGDVARADAADCGEIAGRSTFTCSKDGYSRAKCPMGQLVVEPCPRGCLRMPAGQDSVCLQNADNFACPGAYGTERALDGDYYISAFGCWLDE